MKLITFIKENSYIILKEIANQIGMIMFGLMLSLPVTITGNDTLLLIVGIASAVFYWFLLYTLAWEYGSKEKVRVDANRLPYVPLKGLQFSLVANTLNILAGVLVAVFWFAKGPANQGTASCIAVSSFLNAMYSGITAGANGLISAAKGAETLLLQTSPLNPILHLLYPLPALGICTLGYYLGVHDRHLFGNAPKAEK